MWGGDIRVRWDVAMAALVLSFVFSTCLAWTSRATSQGPSYQGGFVQAVRLAAPGPPPGMPPPPPAAR